MKIVFFLSAYMLAYVPMMFACLAVCYVICSFKLLYDCFGRPRATVHVVTHVGMSVINTTLAILTTLGLYALGHWASYNPTIPITLMFIFPGLSCFAILPAFLREAERDLHG